MLTMRLALLPLFGLAFPVLAQLDGRIVSPDGALEGAEYHRQSETLAATWRSRKLPCQVVHLPRHDHFLIVAELEDPSSTLSRLLLRQMGLR